MDGAIGRDTHNTFRIDSRDSNHQSGGGGGGGGGEEWLQQISVVDRGRRETIDNHEITNHYF